LNVQITEKISESSTLRISHDFRIDIIDRRKLRVQN